MNHISLQPAAPSKQPSSSLVHDVAEELRRYDEHLRDVRGLAAGTRHQRISITGRLLHWKFADRGHYEPRSLEAGVIATGAQTG